MKLPDLLNPQATFIHPSIPDVHIPKATPLLHKWTANPRIMIIANLEYCGEMVFAEIAILRCFQQEGWDGRRIDNFGGKRKYRVGYSEMPPRSLRICRPSRRPLRNPRQNRL